MKSSRLIIALTLVLLLLSNGFAIYQNNKNKIKIDKLQTSMENTQNGLRTIDGDVHYTSNNVDDLTSKVSNICDALKNCY